MHDAAVPKSQSRFYFALPPFQRAVLKLLEQEVDLLAECVQAFPPRAALVLVSVAREDFVEERVDVVKHGDFMRRCVHECCCCDGGWRCGGGGHG